MPTTTALTQFLNPNCPIFLTLAYTQWKKSLSTAASGKTFSNPWTRASLKSNNTPNGDITFFVLFLTICCVEERKNKNMYNTIKKKRKALVYLVKVLVSFCVLGFRQKIGTRQGHIVLKFEKCSECYLLLTSAVSSIHDHILATSKNTQSKTAGKRDPYGLQKSSIVLEIDVVKHIV
jgi:hypothetical protein